MTFMLVTAISALSLSATSQVHDHSAGHEDHAHAHDEMGTTTLPEEISTALEEGGTLVTADVLGMVCDFCAVAMTRTFGRRDEVSAVHVDLDAKTLQIVVREHGELDDETITDLVRRSGYQLEAIRRGEPE